jgi:hydroxymethylglutaryl-CoA lyase
MLEAGFRQVQLTSFVNPNAVPQLRDAEEVSRAVFQSHGVDGFSALTANQRGVERACGTGYQELTWAMSVSDSHNRANVNKTSAESMAAFKQAVQSCPHIRFKLDLGTSFGCPYEGETPLADLLRAIENGLDAGASEICLCDTIGVANPRQVREAISRAIKEFPDTLFALHFHDTWGMGLANIVMALDEGVTLFESSIAGMGGCPFAPGALGNVATEDLSNMMDWMGIQTGLDTRALIETGRMILNSVDNRAAGRLIRIGRSESCYSIQAD